MPDTAALPSGIAIAHESFGDPGDPPVLLVMGLATQMIAWPDAFCETLAARGRHVVRFDNRDVGLSTHLHDAPGVDLGAVFGGDHSAVPYRLSDMAADAVGLLDALGLDRAHVVGMSMGGMIAQVIAIEHPARVASLTSIMSTTGDRSVGGATQAALGALLAPAATSRDEAVERALVTSRIIGSPGFPLNEDAIRARAGLAFDRAHDPAGVTRQLAAIQASPDRTAALGAVTAPTVVIHGAQDPLVDLSGGKATAAAVPGARLVVVDGMGHDLPEGAWPLVIDEIVTVSSAG